MTTTPLLRPLACLLLPLLLAVANPALRAQQPTPTPTAAADDDDDKPLVNSPSPDGRYALRTSTGHPEEGQDAQKTCDLIEKTSGKVLLRLAQSDVDDLAANRFGASAVWSHDSRRFALCAHYNHFGSEISLFVRRGDAFRKVEMPKFEVPAIPERLKHGKRDWKWTGLNDQNVLEWRKDGSLLIHAESTLQGLGSDVYLTAERDVVVGFSPSDTKAKILKSTQQTLRHTGENQD